MSASNGTGEVITCKAELEECPRCESDNVRLLRTMPDNATQPCWIHYVQCADCGIQIPPYRLKPTFLLYTDWRDAVADWNTRPAKRRKRSRGLRTKRVGRKPTIRDVADLANVSTATVSHVINDSRSVESPTRTAVEKAIAKLGYQPNEAARQLARGRHRTPPDVAS